MNITPCKIACTKQAAHTDDAATSFQMYSYQRAAMTNLIKTKPIIHSLKLISMAVTPLKKGRALDAAKESRTRPMIPARPGGGLGSRGNQAQSDIIPPPPASVAGRNRQPLFAQRSPSQFLSKSRSWAGECRAASATLSRAERQEVPRTQRGEVADRQDIRSMSCSNIAIGQNRRQVANSNWV